MPRSSADEEEYIIVGRKGAVIALSSISLTICGVQTKRIINRAVLPAATPVHTPQTLGGHVKVSRTACSSLLLQNDILHETRGGAIATARGKRS